MIKRLKSIFEIRKKIYEDLENIEQERKKFILKRKSEDDINQIMKINQKLNFLEDIKTIKKDMLVSLVDLEMEVEAVETVIDKKIKYIENSRMGFDDN